MGLAGKACTKCQKIKSSRSFYVDARCRDGRRRECIACTKAQNRDWYRRNRKAQNDRSYRWKLAQGKRYIQERRRAEALTERQRVEIYIHHWGLCHLCGEPCHPNRMHIDHVVPLLDGGTSAMSNLAPAHAECNWRKRHGYANRHDPIRPRREDGAIAAPTRETA